MTYSTQPFKGQEAFKRLLKKRWELLGAEDGTETVAIVDIVVIGVRARVVAGYPSVVVVDLL